MEISKCLKDTRIQNHMTQEDLADKLGISRQTVSSWENGKSYPDLVSIIKISDLYDISLDRMLKEDQNLINNMQEKMDTVKSNKSILFTLILATILFGGAYIIRTFIDIPKIDNLGLNLILLFVFVVGLFAYIVTNLNVSHFLNKKTSNKSIVKTSIVGLMILSIFIFFPLIESIYENTVQVFIGRISILVILSIACLFLFKKIDKC